MYKYNNIIIKISFNHYNENADLSLFIGKSAFFVLIMLRNVTFSAA